MSVIFVFLPKPQSASALCDIMEVLSYFRQQKGFVAGWVLLKQLHGVWGSLETGTQEGKEAGLGRRRVWKDLTQSGGKLCSEYIQSQCPALGSLALLERNVYIVHVVLCVCVLLWSIKTKKILMCKYPFLHFLSTRLWIPKILLSKAYFPFQLSSPVKPASVIYPHGVIRFIE